MTDTNEPMHPLDNQFVSADDALAEDIAATVGEEEDSMAGDGMLTANIIRKIQERFEEASRHRDSHENRWGLAYRNYRGLYAKNIKLTENEKSKVFVKATKTKVLAAYGQLLDVLFGTNKFPITISATDVPEGAAKLAHFKGDGAPTIEAPMAPASAVSAPMEMDSNPFNVGYEGDGSKLSPGTTFKDISAGINKKLLGEQRENADKFVQGVGLEGQPTIQPAKDAASRMERLIHDQIQESGGSQELRSALFEAALLGTGIIKGPFTYKKVLHRWTYDPETKQRTYTPETVKVPRLEFVSVFDAFPDPSGNNMDEVEWFIQRHKLSRSQLRGLKNRPYFKVQKINEVLGTAPNYVQKDYEQELSAENGDIQPNVDRYEVLEYWGVMDKKDLEASGMILGDKYSDMEEVQINAWTCAGKLLRLVINPFTPKRIPYLAFDYERNPYTFFGVGVAENMADSQQIMNGHLRMAIDNLALAGNLVFDVDENALVPGQTMEIHPGKIFKRQSGQPGQAIYGLKFPNTAPENMQIFDKFRQIADEVTGIPSYAHGQTGVMSTTRTAAGMSMLMGAASMNVKTVVKNVDDFLLRPLGEAMFQWNMSYYEGEIDIVGDLEVKAGGTSSLMQNEIMSQRLTAFAQLFQNPALASFIKIPAYIRAFVESLDLDPEEFLNSPEEAAVYAQIIGQTGGLGQGMSQMPAQAGMPGDVPPPAMPGMEEFAGTEQLPQEPLQ